jgi:hypothetical protein
VSYIKIVSTNKKGGRITAAALKIRTAHRLLYRRPPAGAVAFASAFT